MGRLMENLHRRWRMRPRRRYGACLIVTLAVVALFHLRPTSEITPRQGAALPQQAIDLTALLGHRTVVKIANKNEEDGTRREILRGNPSSQHKFSELNVTKYALQMTLFFNRVPKVGFQTMMVLLKALSKRNHFRYAEDVWEHNELYVMKPDQERRFSAALSLFRAPTAYIKHTRFVDFVKHYSPLPIYFNMVREPVERVISWYYYIRAPWYYNNRNNSGNGVRAEDWLNKDFQQCVLDGDSECQYHQDRSGGPMSDTGQLTAFFCGMDDECSSFNSRGAMQRAKRNVERYYAVVGVLEEINMTLTVLERYIPRFYAGASAIYSGQRRLTEVDRNTLKKPVSQRIKNMLRNNFTNEIEFYEFCKQRLYQQYLSLI